VEAMLKPIETTFNGHRFRSRLEARWAVFFTVLEVPYDYEAQGYNFEEYAYLPDFWIPSWNVFVEIKPFRPDADEMRRYIAFAKHAEKSLLLFYGNASADEHRVLWCSPSGYEADDLQLASCRKGCGQMFIESQKWGCQAFSDVLTDCECLSDCAEHRLGRDCNGRPYVSGDSWPLIWDKLREALDAAQGARFEFGEAWHAALPRNAPL
jgi:hypothetical protein